MIDWPNFIAFADDNFNMAKVAKLVSNRVENIARKGENAGDQHFLLFPQCFQKFTFSVSLKVGIVWDRINKMTNFGLSQIEVNSQTTISDEIKMG